MAFMTVGALEHALTLKEPGMSALGATLPEVELIAPHRLPVALDAYTK